MEGTVAAHTSGQDAVRSEDGVKELGTLLQKLEALQAEDKLQDEANQRWNEQVEAVLSQARKEKEALQFRTAAELRKYVEEMRLEATVRMQRAAELQEERFSGVLARQQEILSVYATMLRPHVVPVVPRPATPPLEIPESVQTRSTIRSELLALDGEMDVLLGIFGHQIPSRACSSPQSELSELKSELERLQRSSAAPVENPGVC
eukprot:RCo011088